MPALAASLMLVALADSAAAGPLEYLQDLLSTQYEKGKAAYFRHDYATAMQLLRPLADKGDTNAQWFLGLMYEMGFGVPRNYAEAVKWFRLSAQGGNALGQFNLAEMYLEGWGVPKDEAAAIRWYSAPPMVVWRRHRAILAAPLTAPVKLKTMPSCV